uniref:Uncharacterized protein n=1 Tax=Pseudomonas phage Pavpe01 TaxID=3138545 RepID=A0AAU6W1D7_9VIRU
MTRKNVLRLLTVIAVVLLLGLVGRMDYDDAVLQEKAYCANVHSGLWPDYEGRYTADCEDGQVIEK